MVTKDITATKIGVLGGGQLGRMMIQSAIDFNLDISVLDPDPQAPCAHLVENFQTGRLTDENDVLEWGKHLDLITIEIENVSTEALIKLRDQGVVVYPQPEVIALIQDKRKQKTFYKTNGIPTADFVLIQGKEDAAKVKNRLPGVNKLGKEGYDGKGVEMIKDESDLEKIFDQPGIIEKFIDFQKEISVIVARNARGEMKCFPVVELSYHPQHHLVEFLYAPAQIPMKVAHNAYKLAEEVIEKLGMVGLLSVEMFLDKSGRLLVNEVAPRTHNSGHHTLEANITSQFEQHIRAILNLPLGSTDLITPAAMINLLGEDSYTGLSKYEGLNECLAMKGIHLHLYGKKITRPFRKMGHVTITDPDVATLKSKARKIKDVLKVRA